MIHFKSLVNLLINNWLKDNLGTYKAYCNKRSPATLTVPGSIIYDGLGLGGNLRMGLVSLQPVMVLAMKNSRNKT